MTTVTLWILLITAYGERPPVVVDRFATEADCVAAARPLVPTGVMCLRATVIR